MASCLGSHKLEVWTVPYQHPDVGHHSSKNLHSAFLGVAGQVGKFQCQGAHGLDGQAQQSLSRSAHSFLKRGSGIYWRDVDALAVQARHSLCSAPEREHVYLEGGRRSGEIISPCGALISKDEHFL